MSHEAAKEAVRRLLLKDRDALPTPAGTEFVKTLSGFDRTDTAHEPIDLDALSPAQFLSTALINGPSEREREILVRRLGLEGSQRQTLEEIAGDYGLTRERIRQLERSGLKKCRLGANRAQFKRYLETKENEIWRLLAGDRPFLPRGRVKAETQLPGLVRLSLEVVFGGAEGWLNRYAKSIEAGWVRSGLPADEEAAVMSALSSQSGEGEDGWRERIEAAVDAAAWPLALGDLAARSGGIPQGTIADYLEERYGAVIEGGVVVKLERLGAAERLIYVLRDAGSALHTSQIRARHHKLFGVDISESAIGSTLARLKEALIVERGTYDLYENLDLSPEKIATIRDQVHAYLDSKGRFISTKVIQADLFAIRPLECNATLSPYVLLGLVQDDERFVVKRGLMVGLRHFNPDETFASLEDSVHELVAEHGPISVPEIVARMADERRVFDTSVALILKDSTEIVAVGKGRYDLTTRAFGSEVAIRRLERAVELCLLEGKLSLHGLLARLRAVGVAANSHVVDSWIRKVPRFAVSDGIFALAQRSAIVERYERAFSELCESRLHPAVNRQRLAERLQNSEAAELIELDYRMTEARGRAPVAPGRSGEEGAIIDELLSEFEFEE
jgi:RNA polymerase primary sigma factor